MLYCIGRTRTNCMLCYIGRTRTNCMLCYVPTGARCDGPPVVSTNGERGPVGEATDGPGGGDADVSLYPLDYCLGCCFFVRKNSYFLRDWSLITGRGGGLKTGAGGGGGRVKFYPYKKGGGRKKF